MRESQPWPRRKVLEPSLPTPKAFNPIIEPSYRRKIAQTASYVRDPPEHRFRDPRCRGAVLSTLKRPREMLERSVLTVALISFFSGLVSSIRRCILSIPACQPSQASDGRGLSDISHAPASGLALTQASNSATVAITAPRILTADLRTGRPRSRSWRCAVRTPASRKIRDFLPAKEDFWILRMSGRCFGDV